MTSLITTAGPCPPKASCTAFGQGEVGRWVQKVYTQSEMTGTIVIVQVVNTVLGTTSFSTIQENIPSGYVPPMTNEAGTKIAKATYVHQGTTYTTILAYPTPHLTFPDTFRVQGSYLLSNSTPRCVINANQTWPILTEPQPLWRFNDPKWNLSIYYDPNDPLGWGYGYNEETSLSSPEPIAAIIDLLPDDNPDMPHAVVKSCSAGPINAPYVVKANANWRVVAQTSVSYEGQGGKGSISSSRTTSTVGGGGETRESAGSGEARTATVVQTGTSIARGEGTTTGVMAGPTSPDNSQGSSKGMESIGSQARGGAGWPLWAAIWMGCITVITCSNAL